MAFSGMHAGYTNYTVAFSGMYAGYTTGTVPHGAAGVNTMDAWVTKITGSIFNPYTTQGARLGSRCTFIAAATSQ